MLIQFVIIIFIIIAVWRLAIRFRKKEITLWEFLAWFVFWVLIGLATAWPKATDVLANRLGVERGFNLLVALAIIFVFYLVFRIFIRLEKLDKEITKVVREIAKREEKGDK